MRGLAWSDRKTQQKISKRYIYLYPREDRAVGIKALHFCQGWLGKLLGTKLTICFKWLTEQSRYPAMPQPPRAYTFSLSLCFSNSKFSLLIRKATQSTRWPQLNPTEYLPGKLTASTKGPMHIYTNTICMYRYIYNWKNNSRLIFF